jgi:hypothetical protein
LLATNAAPCIYVLGVAPYLLSTYPDLQQMEFSIWLHHYVYTSCIVLALMPCFPVVVLPAAPGGHVSGQLLLLHPLSRLHEVSLQE